MTNWKREIKLNHIINSRPELIDEDDLPISIAEAVCEILEKDPELNIFSDEIRLCITVEEFNGEMDNIYDYCDDNKILIN